MRQYTQESLSHLLKDKNSLIFGENSFEHLDPIFKMFNLTLMEEITEYTLNNFSSTILNNSIDVLIINDIFCTKEIINILQSTLEEENINVLICFNENYPFCDELINLAHSMFCNSITIDQFGMKLYYMINDQNNLQKEISNKQHKYIDSAEIEILFLRDELLFIVKKIDSGNINKEIIHKIILTLVHINNIYERYLIYSQKIKLSITNLKSLLETINLKSYDDEDKEVFSHLARFLEDISVFLDNYFIKRVYDNLYVVEDSMENSLQFLKAAFEKQDPKNDGSTLEFFYD